MSRGKGLLNSISLVVDAPVERSGPEEGGLGTGRVEDVHQPRGELVRAVVVGKREHSGLAALLDDHAGGWGPLHELDRVRGRGSDGAGGQGKAAEDSLGKHVGIVVAKWPTLTWETLVSGGIVIEVDPSVLGRAGQDRGTQALWWVTAPSILLGSLSIYISFRQTSLLKLILVCLTVCVHRDRNKTPDFSCR